MADRWHGHGGAPPLFSFIKPCRAASVESFAYLADIITRLPGLPVGRAAELTPRAWAASRPR